MGFAGGPNEVLVANQTLVARCMGEMEIAVAGVCMVSITINSRSQMADGMCHVLPNALFRWYSVLSGVMFAARCPSKPIICSLMLAGARCLYPSASDTRYFCWYCHGANRW